MLDLCSAVVVARTKLRQAISCCIYQRLKVGVRFCDSLELGNTYHNVQSQQWCFHLVSNERSELSQTEIVAICLNEKLLSCIESIYDKTRFRRLETYMLQAWKLKLGVCNMISFWIKDAALKH